MLWLIAVEFNACTVDTFIDKKIVSFIMLYLFSIFLNKVRLLMYTATRQVLMCVINRASTFLKQQGRWIVKEERWMNDR